MRGGAQAGRAERRDRARHLQPRAGDRRHRGAPRVPSRPAVVRVRPRDPRRCRDLEGGQELGSQWLPPESPPLPPQAGERLRSLTRQAGHADGRRAEFGTRAPCPTGLDSAGTRSHASGAPHGPQELQWIGTTQPARRRLGAARHVRNHVQGGKIGTGPEESH